MSICYCFIYNQLSHTHTYIIYIYLDQPKSQGSGTIFWELRLVFATLWTGFRQVQVRRTSRTSRTAGGLWKKVGFWCCWMLVWSELQKPDISLAILLETWWSFGFWGAGYFWTNHDKSRFVAGRVYGYSGYLAIFVFVRRRQVWSWLRQYGAPINSPSRTPMPYYLVEMCQSAGRFVDREAPILKKWWHDWLEGALAAVKELHASGNLMVWFLLQVLRDFSRNKRRVTHSVGFKLFKQCQRLPLGDLGKTIQDWCFISCLVDAFFMAIPMTVITCLWATDRMLIPNDYIMFLVTPNR